MGGCSTAVILRAELHLQDQLVRCPCAGCIVQTFRWAYIRRLSRGLDHGPPQICKTYIACDSWPEYGCGLGADPARLHDHPGGGSDNAG